MYKALLREILLCHAKVPLEFLFLETGSLSVRHILSSRRMNYVRTLLKREDDELTKRILREQQNNPTAGDFTEMIKDDFKMCSITYNELERWKQSEQSRRCNGSQGEDISAFSFLHNGLYVYCARLDNGCSWTVA